MSYVAGLAHHFSLRQSLVGFGPAGPSKRWAARGVVLLAFVLLAGSAATVIGPQPGAAAPAGPACVDETASEAHAVAVAVACNRQVAVTSKTSETTMVWAKPDGTFTAEIHAGVVRMRDGNGGWNDVDLNFVRRPDGSVGPKLHPRGLVLSGAVGEGEHDLAVLGSGDEQLAVGWRGRLPEPVLEGPKATYRDVKPGVDLVVETTRNGFETFFVVKDRAAAKHVASLALPWRSGELTGRATDRGELELRDKSGKARAGMREALMWDARTHPVSGEPAHQVKVGVGTQARGAGKADLVLTPDADFMTDPSTVYPVVIDPQWDIWAINGHHDTWVENTGGTGWNSVELKLGTWNGGGEIARSFIFWDLAPFYGASINWATLWLYETWAYSCRDAEWQLWLSEYFDHNTNWWNQPPWHQYQTSSWATTGYDSCEGDGWVSTDARSFFQIAADSGYGYWTMGLKAGLEWHSDSWKRFRSSNSSYGDPQVTINFEYNQAPNTPTSVKPTGDCHPSCTSGSTVRVTAPTLQAVVSDPNPSHRLNVQLEVRNQAKTSVVASTTQTNVASGSTVTWTTPALTNGTTYHYRARAQDQWGAWSNWSGDYTFTVNTAGPGTPTGVGVSGTGDCYLSCASPAMLRSLRPTFKATVPHPYGDALSVAFEVWNAGKTAVVASTTKTNVPAGTTPTWQPSTNLPQQSQMHLRVRSKDAYGRWGSWSGYYTFTTDTQAPAAPVVSSTVYRHKDTGTWNGGAGVPGSFTFGPNGSGDVLKYEFRMNGGTISSASVAPGASHTRDITPAGDLEQLLEVRSIDQAGWTSAWVPYPFLVRAQPVDVAYWKFDELSGTSAAAATGGPDYAGTRIGGSGWAQAGINQSNPAASGNAVSLDGVNDYVEMPRVLATHHAAGFSVSAWVNPTSLSTYHAVVSQQGANVFAFRLYYKPEVGRWCFAVRAADDASATTHGVCSDATPQVGVWTHLVGVYDRSAGKVRLYVNGGPQNGQTVPGTANEESAPAMWSATGSFRVGRSFDDEYWHGLVDEVRTYQRALPEVEARQIFLDCWEGDCPQVPAPQEPAEDCIANSAPPCVGEWALDEGSGSTAGDSSGLGRDVTFNGGAAWTTDGYRGSAAVNFDGTSGYLATQEPALLTDQSFSVSAWVKPDEIGPGVSVMQQTGTAASSFVLGTSSSMSNWAFATTSHNGVVHTWHTAISATPARAGTWTQIVGVHDAAASENRLYVNGQLVAVSGSAAAQASLPGTPLLIGGTSWGAGIDGTVDLVRTYQGALTDAQVSGLYADQLAPPDVRAWFELEEWDVQAYDYSENGNHGTLSEQGAEWTVDGYDGSSAVTFDGVSGSISTAGLVLDTADSFSVTAWANLADTSADHAVISQDGAMNSAFLLYSSATSNQWCFSMRHSDTPGPSATQVCGPAPQVGVWTHVSGVYDAAAGELRLYVNGAPVGTQSLTASTWSANGPLVVGRGKHTDAGGTTALDFHYAGTIDGVRAYQGALSDAQATAVFNGQEP